MPVLASFALHVPKGPRGREDESALVALPRARSTAPLLDGALARRKAVVAVAGLALLLLASRGLPLLGSEFLPKLDEGALWVRVDDARLDRPDRGRRASSRRVRGILASFPEVKTVVSQLGRPDDGTDVNGFDTAEIYVDLRPRERVDDRARPGGAGRRDEREALRDPGRRVQFSQVIEDNVNEAVSGIKGELGVKIFGEDPDDAPALADRVADVIESVPGAADVAPERLAGQPQVQIAIDRDAIARYGLSVCGRRDGHRDGPRRAPWRRRCSRGSGRSTWSCG